MLIVAYKFIRFERTKSMGILAAIIISIYLIGIELGIFFYLANLIGGIVNNAIPDQSQVFVVKKETININQLSQFDSRWIQQIRSIKGVDNTHGVAIANVLAKFPNLVECPAIVIGSESPIMAAGPTDANIVDGNRRDLLVYGTVSADVYDKRTFDYDVKKGTQLEINGKMATVVVSTKNAKGFTSPIFYTTLSKARYFSNISPYMINAVIVNVRDASLIDNVVNDINKMTPDLKAWRAKELETTSVINVMIANNMGMSFATLIIFGIISSFLIIGLTMYSATLDRIKDYGTLKAIGASSKYITRLVVAQSLVYAVIGYITSLTLLLITKIGMAKGGLIISFPPLFLLSLFIITLIITVGSSYFSIVKIKRVEPSSIFR